MADRWTEAPGHPRYEVSDDGRVRLKSGALMRPGVNKNGYVQAVLWSGSSYTTVYMHRLVCEAFHGPPPLPKMDAAHGNGIRSDNRASNLAWKTRKENEADKKAHGTAAVGAANGHALLSDNLVRALRADYAAMLGSRSRLQIGHAEIIARRYGIKEQSLRKVIRGEVWSHVK